MEWTTSGASRLRLKASRSFGARRASTKRGAKPTGHQSSTIVAASKRTSHGEFTTCEDNWRGTFKFVAGCDGNRQLVFEEVALTRASFPPPFVRTATKGRRHGMSKCIARKKGTNRNGKPASNDPSRVRFADSWAKPAATCSASSGPRQPLALPPPLSKAPPKKGYPSVANASGMARLKRHMLDDFDPEEKREEQKPSPKGERQGGGEYRPSVANRQVYSRPSPRTPSEHPRNLLVVAERRAILLQELARRGIAFPAAAVASSRGGFPYPLSNDQQHIQSGMSMDLAASKSQTGNTLRDSGDYQYCQWPPIRFFDSGAEVSTQGRPLSQLHGCPVQLKEKRLLDEMSNALCKGVEDFLPTVDASQAGRTAIIGAKRKTLKRIDPAKITKRAKVN